MIEFNNSDHAQSLVLLRGLPGAGKTTLAKNVFIGYDYFDADMFINKDEPFDRRNLMQAHEKCQSYVEQNLLNGFDTIVGNTFTQNLEMKPYVDMARELGVNLFVITVENSHGNQSIHNVPETTIKKMKDRFEEFNL